MSRNHTEGDDGAPKSAPKESAAKKRVPPKARMARWSLNLLAAGVWAFIAGLLVVGYLVLTLPPLDAGALSRRPNVLILDATGGELVSYGDIYGATVALKDLPPHLPAAVLSIEDRRFYDHFGIDLRALARATVVNVKAGTIVQGGSTITQQVAKNLFLTPERNIGRKLREMLLAVWLERQFTKDEILTIYLNRAYLGAGTYGVEAAAQRYFGRSARKVNVYQSAVLAGLLKAPSRYNPANDADLAKSRAEIVLATMVDTGALTPGQAKSARDSAAKILKVAEASKRTLRARHFADWILSQLDSYVGTIDRDLIVRTTLDASDQAAAESALTKHLGAVGKAQNIGEGAVVALGPDGAVRAMVGGRNYDDSQFNRATQALRQPGSAFKPFVFLAALEGGYKPDDLVTDGPIAIGKWKPKNFSGTYAGPVTVEEALVESLNTVAVRLAREVGPKAVINVAHRLGMTEDFKPELSLALGTGEVTLLELTSAYAPFANGGFGVLPYAILEVKERGGRVLYSRQGAVLGRVMAEDKVATMNQMLHGVIERGTGTAADFGYPAAGKTGTSSDFRDALFVGYTPELVTGVWVGNDSGAFMKGVTGAGAPARIWRDVMAAAHKDRKARELPGLERDDTIVARFWRAIFGD